MLPMSASAQATLLEENFDTYADTAALNAVWTEDLVGYTLMTDGGHSGANYVQTGTTNAGRFSHPINVTATDEAPVEVSFWTRVPSTASGRSYLQLEGATPGTHLVNFGQYNNPGGGEWNYRTFGGGTPAVWDTTDVAQVANEWTNLKVIIEARRVRYYVNDVQAAEETRTDSDWPEFLTIRFGFSPSSSAITVDYDDISVKQVSSVNDWNLY